MSDTKQETCLQKSYSKRYFTASFRADPELWSRFKGGCAERGASICHVLEALMEAWLEGQKATATVIKPVTVNLTMQHVVQRPRRMASYDGYAQVHCSIYSCRQEAALEMEKVARDGSLLHLWSCLEHRDHFLDRGWQPLKP